MLPDRFLEDTILTLDLIYFASLSFYQIVSGNLFISLFILLGMLGFVIVAIHCQGWRLTKTLGGMMLVFYAGFLTQAIILELPFRGLHVKSILTFSITENCFLHPTADLPLVREATHTWYQRPSGENS